MAEWRDFQATNDDKTCLWCGQKLRLRRGRPDPSTEPRLDQYPPDNAHPWADDLKKWRASAPIEGYGDYADGFFCGLRCGYQFGVRMAQLGKRLKATGS